MKRKTSFLYSFEEKNSSEEARPSDEEVTDYNGTENFLNTEPDDPTSESSSEEVKDEHLKKVWSEDETQEILASIHQSNLSMARQLEEVKDHLNHMDVKIEHYVIRTINEVMEYLEDELERNPHLPTKDLPVYQMDVKNIVKSKRK